MSQLQNEPSAPPSPTELAEVFRRELRGEVRADPVARGAYATDAGIYQFIPLLVIEPLDRDDLLAAIRICHVHKLPIVPRGGGTSLVGQSIGGGVVIDASRHCRRIIEFNAAERWVRVEPGLVRDELNRFLKPHGLHFAPDPATSSRANIGGMIANNSGGMRSLQYGMTIDHLLGLDVALSDGEVVRLGPILKNTPALSERLSRLVSSLQQIIDRERDEIIRRFPAVARRNGGYPLDAFVGTEPWNLAKLMAGSEGTLGMILEAKLNLEFLPKCSGLCLAHFHRLGDGLRAVQPVIEQGPSAVELIDGTILRQAREHPLTTSISRMIEGIPEALLIIEARADHPAEVSRRLQSIQSALLDSGTCHHAPVIENPGDVQAVWQMRESALGLLTTVPGDRKPVPYIEDAAVPLDVLPDYIEDVLAICANHGQPVSLFAHAGAGLIHIRPRHDLHRREDIDQMLRIQDEVYALVKKYRGSWSAEHGDGIIRGGFNRDFFGDRIFQAFQEVKQLFDPDGLMNPGKLLDPPPRDQNLRFGAYAQPLNVPTAFRWEGEGGMPRAAEQCTGIGACRQVKSGVMCPSYMATRDELQSTRGRANVLRLALSGQLGPEALQRDDVFAIFDLCISCKGCRSECPNKVDVGKMKAELQYQYYQHHRRPLRHHLFAHAARLGAWCSGWRAPMVNTLLGSRTVKALLEKSLGIDARRTLPIYASQRLSSWFASRPQPDMSGKPRVVLFNDIYTEYHEPEIGRAAIRLLELAGYEVKLFGPADSQRPALSMGKLGVARREGTKLMNQLARDSEDDGPILVIEPSCATALIQDLPELVDSSETARKVLGRVRLLDDFLLAEINAGRASLPCGWAPGQEMIYHPHCHERALNGGRSMVALLSLLTGAQVATTNAGCCGMAGSFGYEKEHYDVSVQMAEDRLLPALRACKEHTVVLASGFSCRHQIADLAPLPVQHPLAWIDEQIRTMRPTR